MRKYFYILAVAVIAITSCSKKKDINPGTDGDGTTTGPSKDGSTLDLIRDSIYLYAQQTYYWNTLLPTYTDFKPRSFSASTDINALSDEVDALSQYAINPATGQPYEYYKPAPGYAKYSFIDDGTVSGELGGVKGDFGFAPFWPSANDLRIKYVYPGSPADLKGIKRGYQIVKVNDKTDLSDTDANIDFIIKAYSNSNSITMTLKKPDGTTFDVAMATASYTVNPVLTYKVIDLGGGKKVGYMVFNSFTSLANAKPRIDEAFTAFKSASVTDLVIDLRYNGGGYVETAEYLSNLMAPSSAFGTTMYSYTFNQTMASGKATILKNQVRKDNDGSTYNYGQFDYTTANNTVPFAQQSLGSFATLNNIIFIVTGSTASASELTINNLLPKRNVKIVGTTSYGKPVGFFDIKINKYELYIPQFETKNSDGKGGYYAGMEPASPSYPGYKAADDVSKDFGDPNEKLLSYALNFIKSGNYITLSTPAIQGLSTQKMFSVDESRDLSLKMDQKLFKGMIVRTPKSK